VVTMAELADGKRPRDRTSSRGRLLAAAAALLLLAAPRKSAASCCWRSRRLAAGTQVLLTCVGQLKPRLRQQVRQRMWVQSFLALLPQSWQLVPALPPPAPAPPAPPIPPAPSCEEKPSTTPVATAPEEKNCDVCGTAAAVACWCGCQSWNPIPPPPPPPLAAVSAAAAGGRGAGGGGGRPSRVQEQAVGADRVIAAPVTAPPASAAPQREPSHARQLPPPPTIKTNARGRVCSVHHTTHHRAPRPVHHQHQPHQRKASLCSSSSDLSLPPAS
jgi:hypothetical protein